MRPSPLLPTLLLLVGCKTLPVDSAPAECDADTDADTDTDSDTDSDSDGDTDYTVCGDGSAPFSTVQDAVDAPTSGDVIRLCAGTYEETISVTDTELTIVGADGYQVTFLIGYLSPTISVIDATLELEELTIGGYTPAYTGVSGIRAEGATLSVHGCRIAGNLTKALQAFAIWAEDTTSTWESVTFEDNFVFGLASFTDCDTTLRHAVFRFNTYSPFTPDEGWLLSHEGGTFDLANALFYENLAVEPDAPIRIDSGTVRNTVFYHNNNLASDVFARAEPGVVWENNIFFDNDVCGLTVDAGAHAAYNAASANTYGSYGNLVDYCLTDGAALDDSNIDEEPVFVAYPSWDFHLAADDAHCIDAGNPDEAFNDPDGSRNDMGAYGGLDGSW